MGEDAAGDSLLLALTRAGVGHAAVLRDPARPTLRVEPVAVGAAGDDDLPSPLADPDRVASPSAAASGGPRLEAADIDLAIRYLEPSGVLVVTDDVSSEVLAAAVASSGYAGMPLVVLVSPGALAARTVPAGLPEDATVLAAPEGDGGAFEALVAAYAAALDGGSDPAAAFAAAQGGTGWEAAAAD